MSVVIVMSLFTAKMFKGPGVMGVPLYYSRYTVELCDTKDNDSPVDL